MTPAINVLKKNKIPFTVHKYQVDMDQVDNYGQAVADYLKVEHQQLFKTLLVSLNGDDKNLAVCIVPVSENLNLKKAAKAHKAKTAVMAKPELAQRATGYVVGGISPLGQKTRLHCVIDQSAVLLNSLFVSAGKRGIQVELSPNHLIDTLGATCDELTTSES
jgi:Cys-tRNA(Pro)/Cys-tRNA(Cys) deacylase